MLAHDVMKACDTKRERIPVCLWSLEVAKLVEGKIYLRAKMLGHRRVPAN